MSKDVGLWGKFIKIEESLRAGVDVLDPEYAEMCRVALSFFRKSQKFYFPADRRILDNRKLDDDIAQLIKIPYPIISILSETHFNPDGVITEKINTHSLTIVFDIATFAEAFLGTEVSNAVMVNSLAYFSLVELPKDQKRPEVSWLLYPMIYLAEHEPGVGYRLRGTTKNKKVLDMQDGLLKDGQSDFETVLNTCAVLNLDNTIQEPKPAPASLNKARVKKGKPGFYDYKILVVDNERWDGPSGKSSHSERDGVRSHFRRGHIRRLETGKAVWVRHTIVQGSKEGFVEKSYSLEHKNAVHKVPPSV